MAQNTKHQSIKVIFSTKIKKRRFSSLERGTTKTEVFDEIMLLNNLQVFRVSAPKLSSSNTNIHSYRNKQISFFHANKGLEASRECRNMLFTDLSWPSVKEVCTAAIIESQYVVVSIYICGVLPQKNEFVGVCVCVRLQFFSKVNASSAAFLLWKYGISSQIVFYFTTKSKLL